MQEKEKAKEHGMRVHIRPLTCCDLDCARSNRCRVGGYQCQVCGMWFCPDTDCGEFFDGVNYTCRSCADEINETGD